MHFQPHLRLAPLYLSLGLFGACAEPAPEHPVGPPATTVDFDGTGPSPIEAVTPVLPMPTREHAAPVREVPLPDPPAPVEPGTVPPISERSMLNENAAQQTYLESLAVEREAEETEREREARAEARETPTW